MLVSRSRQQQVKLCWVLPLPCQLGTQAKEHPLMTWLRGPIAATFEIDRDRVAGRLHVYDALQFPTVPYTPE